MDFSFAGIKLQSIQCITQKFLEVKKSSLHSLCMGAHFVLWAVMPFSKYFDAFCFLQHFSAQSYTDLHSASQRQHLLLHASQRPWLNFEHQLLSHIRACFSSNLTEQNPYEPRWQDWITSANTSHITIQIALGSRKPIQWAKEVKWGRKVE